MKLKYESQINLYLALFLYSILILGVVGIRSGIKKMVIKMDVQKEYKAALENFEKKESLVADLLKDIYEYENEIRELNKAIPNRVQEERYLVDLSIQAARAGYELQRYTVTEVSPTETSIMASFKGDLRLSNRLVENILALDRLSKVESLTGKDDKGDSIVNTRITIFNYSGEVESPE